MFTDSTENDKLRDGTWSVLQKNDIFVHVFNVSDVVSWINIHKLYLCQTV